MLGLDDLPRGPLRNLTNALQNLHQDVGTPSAEFISQAVVDKWGAATDVDAPFVIAALRGADLLPWEKRLEYVVRILLEWSRRSDSEEAVDEIEKLWFLAKMLNTLEIDRDEVLRAIRAHQVPKPTQAWLEFISGDQLGNRVLLRSDFTLIGRDQACDIRLAEAEVSRRHAGIRRQGTSYLIRDLHSTNGTFVNGRRLVPDEDVVLTHGDEMSAGTSLVRFLEHLD
ncbi:FHA domain-containing protein [Actinoplanes sp. NPDC051861]|uniref:FHA domain-containing protein n=1 Tax=Actinoplanes sp. NPDC051861 TaxID=3155170 RepID=UPI00341BD843